MQNDLKILLVDDETEFGKTMTTIFTREGYDAVYIQNPLAVDQVLSSGSFHIMISDVRMPGLGGMDLLKQVRERYPNLTIIMLTGYPTVENAVRAMKLGAENFLAKPILPEVLLTEIDRIGQSIFRDLDNKNSEIVDIISEDKAVMSILNQMVTVADSTVPVLITGESGTGKELVAELLHKRSSRANGPCVKVNCAALPETLLDSELFGVEKGAYTGADRSRKGTFEAAHGGTLFLDEIGDMSLSTQVKILRVIQEHEITRVGGQKVIPVDIRIVAATNRNLTELITRGRFREDLYYRLSVVNCQMPPLRDRDGDIGLLLDYFLSQFNHIYNKRIVGFEKKTRELLASHSWPGNIRELKNCVERACLFCDSDEIQTIHLPAQYTDIPGNLSLGEELEQMNRRKIMEALEQSHGVRKKAAEILEIDRRTLYNRMKKLGIS